MVLKLINNDDLRQEFTLVLSKGKDKQVSIMMQDPSYDQTNVLPLGMEDALSDLTKKQKPYPLKDWVLPDSQVLLNIVKELSEDGVLASQKATMRFESELPELVELWQEQLVSLHQKNETKVTYYQVKKEVIQRWLDKRVRKKTHQSAVV